jgi:hypothetical protein
MDLVSKQILFTLYCIFVLLGVHYGTGVHLVDLPLENIPIAFKVFQRTTLPVFN